jgi:hypothetical protein
MPVPPAPAEAGLAPPGSELQAAEPAGQEASSSIDRLFRLGEAGRLRAFESNRLTRRECFLWAANFPGEPPLIDGELPWIAQTLADFE